MLSLIHRRCAYAALLLLFVSGTAHWVLHGWFLQQGDFGPAPNPLEPWLLKLHGAAAMLGLLLLGSLVSVHVHRFWRLRRNRAAGGVFLSAALLLVVSGYALYYVGGDQSRALSRQVHIVSGLLALPGFLVHLWRGRAARRHPRVDGLRA